MEFYNSLHGYVNVKDLSKETFEKILEKLNCTYTMYEEDGEEYYSFILKRENNFNMSNGTAAKLDFKGVTDEEVDLVVNQLIDTVDNLV